MNRLVKGLEFETVHEYYEYIVESHINGNPQQVKSLYNDMPLVNQDEFKVFVFENHSMITYNNIF